MYSRTSALVIFCLALVGCAGIPDGVEPVQGFQVERYLGKWYEIARLDHRFERGLSHVTATYRPRDDDGIHVLNRGFDGTSGEWQEAVGRAYFVGDQDVGHLKVSFFGPFYGGYTVVSLDIDDYSYAMVCGPNRSYLWILARQPMLDRAIVEALVGKAKALGFDTDALIFVDHDPLPAG